MDYKLHQKSRPVIIVAYRNEWPREFRRLGTRLRSVLGPTVLRIDHIGSTSVSGLAAKDVIDIQITVEDLTDGAAWVARLQSAGYQVRPDIQSDHLPPWFHGAADQWIKRYVREPVGEQRTHLHVRAAGRENQRYALLFRDFLRASPRYTAVYAQIKHRLSELFPESIDSYLFIKDPAVDLIIAAAEDWAAATGWSQGPSDC